MVPTQKERIQSWVALVLTTGEFGIAIWIMASHGSAVYLYLAVTYMIRETSGGKHYHEILVDVFHRNKQYKRLQDEHDEFGV